MSNENEMIECPISPSTNKLLQAYIAISNESPEDILEEIGKTIEEALKKYLLKRTLEAMRDNHGDVLLEFTRENYSETFANEYREHSSSPDDTFLRVATLSSDNDETWNDHRTHNTGSGITDADLDNDLNVDDPNTEAAADALPVDISTPEEMAKLLTSTDPGSVRVREIPAQPLAVNPLEARRRKNIKINAKVSLNADPVSDLGGGVTA